MKKNKIKKVFKRISDPVYYGNCKILQNENIYTDILSLYSDDDFIKLRKNLIQRNCKNYFNSNQYIYRIFNNRVHYLFDNFIQTSIKCKLVNLSNELNIDIFFDKDTFMDNFFMEINNLCNLNFYLDINFDIYANDMILLFLSVLCNSIKYNIINNTSEYAVKKLIDKKTIIEKEIGFNFIKMLKELSTEANDIKNNII